MNKTLKDSLLEVNSVFFYPAIKGSDYSNTKQDRKVGWGPKM